MKTTVCFYTFLEAFERCDRSDQFSREGLATLFDYLESYEEDTGEEIELDAIALCCDYAESTFEEVARDYSISIDYDDCSDDGERAETLKARVLEYLNYHTMVCGEVGNDSVIYQQF